MGVQVASLFGVLSLRDEMTPALQGALTSLNSVGDSLQNIGSQFAPFSAIAAAGLGASVSMAMNFDAAMTNAGSILGNTTEEMEMLNQQVQLLGANSLVGPQAAAEAFYSIVSGVQDATTHMAILEAAIATSEAGGADLTTTTSGLIAVMNAYGLSADDAARVSDVFSRTVQMGVGTMDEFVASLNPLSSLGNQLGVDIGDLGGQMAYMTTQGLTANTSMTAMRQAMVAFINPNTAMTDALAAMGFETGEQAVRTLGLSGALQALNVAVGGSTGEMAAALGSVEALNAGLILGSDAANEFLLTYEDGIDGATEAARALQRESLQAHMQDLRSSVSGVAIEIGQLLTPSLIVLAEKATNVVNGIMDWIMANPDLTRQIAMVAGVIAAVAPVAFSLGTVIKFVGFALGTLMSPIGLVIGAVAALGLAWSTNFMGIRDIVENVFGRLGAAFQFGALALGTYNDVIAEGGTRIQAFSATVAGFVANFATSLFDLDASQFLTLRDGIENSLTGAFEGIQQTVRRIFAAVSPFITEFATFIGNIFERVDLGQIIQIGMTLWSLTNPIGWVMTALRALGVDFVAVFESVMGGLTTFFSVLNNGGSATDALVAVFGDNVIPIIQSLSDIINNVVIPAWNSFIGFLVGSWELIQPALAMIANWFIQDVLPQVVAIVRDQVIPTIMSFVNFLAQAWAIIAPALENLARWFLEEALPQILAFISETVIPAIGDFMETLRVIWETVSPFLLEMLDWFINTGLPLAVEFFENEIIPVIETFIEILETIWDTVSPALESLLEWIVTTGLPLAIDFINDTVLPAIQTFIDVLVGIWGVVQPGLNSLRDGIQGVFEFLTGVVESFVGVVQGVLGAVQDVAGAVGGVIGTGQDFINDPLGSAGDLAGDVLSGIGGFLGFSDGGFTGNIPAHQPAGIVHGQEYVVPRDGALVLEGGGGGDVFNVTINATPGMDGASLARDFVGELENLRRSRG